MSRALAVMLALIERERGVSFARSNAGSETRPMPGAELAHARELETALKRLATAKLAPLGPLRVRKQRLLVLA